VRPWYGHIAGQEGLSFGGDPPLLNPNRAIFRQFSPSIDAISSFLEGNSPQKIDIFATLDIFKI
jgi:hypothetical protein